MDDSDSGGGKKGGKKQQKGWRHFGKFDAGNVSDKFDSTIQNFEIEGQQSQQS